MFRFFQSKKVNAPLVDALKNNPYLLDVRTPEEFARGSAAGAVNIPVDILPVRMNEIPKNRLIIVFCRSGARSGVARELLQKAGYTTVINGGGVTDVQQAQGTVQ